MRDAGDPVWLLSSRKSKNSLDDDAHAGHDGEGWPVFFAAIKTYGTSSRGECRP